MDPQKLREKFGRFRVLIIGRANAGKTTILQRLCNTTDNPEIFDGRGNKIDGALVAASSGRGYHNIEHEMVFGSNPAYVFHDSCGFEAGRKNEFEAMKKFIAERASTKNLTKRIHVIWYCIPLEDHERVITAAEKKFFYECDPKHVPVIVLFTKFDALRIVAFQLLEQDKPGDELTQERIDAGAKELFSSKKYEDQLYKTRYSPKKCICLDSMNEPQASCTDLLACTASVMNTMELQKLLISTQQTNLELCIHYAVEREITPLYTNHVSWASTLRKCIQRSEDVSTEKKIKYGVASWFPYCGNWRALRDRDWDDDDLRRDLLRDWDDDLLLRDRDRDWLDDLLDRDNLRTNWNRDLMVSFTKSDSCKLILFIVMYEEDNELVSSSKLAASKAPIPKTLLIHQKQVLKIGISWIFILEHFFFLSCQRDNISENLLIKAINEYKHSQTLAMMKNAVQSIVSQKLSEEQLSKVIIDFIMENRMSNTLLQNYEE